MRNIVLAQFVIILLVATQKPKSLYIFFMLHECEIVSGKTLSIKKLLSESIHVFHRP